MARTVIGAFVLAVFAFMAIGAPFIAPHDPLAIDPSRALEGPSRDHIFGRDALGRDLFSRTVFGARLALAVSGLGVILGASFGTWIGLWAGYRGGLAERAVVRTVDVLLAFPGFLLALGAAAALGPGAENLVVAVGFFSFPPFVRVARSLAVSIKEEEYVKAAVVMGADSGRIILNHIFSNAVRPLAALVAVRMGAAVSTTAGLAFLGLGPPLPTPEWGAMLDAGREYLWAAPRLVLVPGLALFLSSLSFYLLADGLHGRRLPR